MGKVFADVMLAKLARWSRLAGISVYDAPVEDDTKLLSLVKRSKGVLLTADEELFSRAAKAKVKAFLVSETKLEKQIAYVANALGVRITAEQARICPVCNSTLAKVERTKVAGLVPSEAYRRYRLFYFCRKCNKAYWHGTHWKKIVDRLKKAQNYNIRSGT